jgi:two-component system, cell cycle response regulator DivK
MAKAVLIVDDDPRSMKLSYDLLGVFGYRVLAAQNGLQAVEMAIAHKPDLILMDIQLPIMDGMSATRLIKENVSTRDIPVIAATAFAMNGDKEKVMAAGCSDYITKPIDIRILLKTVEKYLSGNNSDQTKLSGSDRSEEQESQYFSCR